MELINVWWVRGGGRIHWVSHSRSSKVDYPITCISSDLAIHQTKKIERSEKDRAIECLKMNGPRRMCLFPHIKIQTDVTHNNDVQKSHGSGRIWRCEKKKGSGLKRKVPCLKTPKWLLKWKPPHLSFSAALISFAVLSDFKVTDDLWCVFLLYCYDFYYCRTFRHFHRLYSIYNHPYFLWLLLFVFRPVRWRKAHVSLSSFFIGFCLN